MAIRLAIRKTQPGGSSPSPSPTPTPDPTPNPNPTPTPIDPLSLTGLNLQNVQDWATEMPFVNQFKSSRPWTTQRSGVFDTGEFSKLDLNSNGYLKTLTPTSSATFTHVVSVVMNNTLPYPNPTGRWVVRYDGEGTFTSSRDAVINTGLSTPGRLVLNMSNTIPANSGLFLAITSINPSNPIRNIRVTPEHLENSTNRFTSDFIASITPFNTLRFMEWMATNRSTQSTWANRPTLDSYTWSTSYRGVPVEVLVELANQQNANPWFNMPHLCTDEYVTNFATYVKNNLNPNLKIYLEYTNECWNSIFTQYNWLTTQGRALWPEKTDLNARLDYASKRSVEVFQIWDQVFGSDKARVIGLLGCHSENTSVANRLLNYSNWTNNPPTHTQAGVDGICIAPYFGTYLALAENATQVGSWASDPDGGLNKIFTEINQGGLVTGGPVGGALAKTNLEITRHKTIANNHGIRLIGYEGGQHLSPVGATISNTTIVNMMLAANRDPRMGTAMVQYLNNWYSLADDFICLFTHITKYDNYGAMGLKEHVAQTNAHKYNAIVAAIS